MLVDIDVWSGDLYAGTLPPICVFTGEATPGVHTVRYSVTPRWVWALLFAGIVPFVVATLLLRRRVIGTLPMCTRALKRFVVLRVVSLVVVLVIPIGCFAAAALVSGSSSAASSALVLAGSLELLAGAVACALWSGFIGIAGCVEDRPGWGRWVRLRGVNPTFAAAVQRLYASRMPRWQMGTVPTGFSAVVLPDGYAPAPQPMGWMPPGSSPIGDAGYPPAPPRPSPPG